MRVYGLGEHDNGAGGENLRQASRRASAARLRYPVTGGGKGCCGKGESPGSGSLFLWQHTRRKRQLTAGSLVCGERFGKIYTMMTEEVKYCGSG